MPFTKITAIGQYSFTACKTLSEGDARCLVDKFKTFKENTNEIYIIENRDYPGNYRFLYRNWQGLTWIMRCETEKECIQEETLLYSPYNQYWLNNRRPGYLYENPKPKIVFRKKYTLEAHINPKVFTGIQEYIADASVDHLKAVEKKFNQEAKRISQTLGEFSSYKIDRGKYSIDFDLEKQRSPCTSEQMLVLLKRGDSPYDYEYFIAPDEDYPLNHIRPIDKLYQKCESVSFNYYEIKNQPSNKNSDNRGMVTPRNAVRFVIECKYDRRCQVSRQLTDDSEVTNEILNEIYSDDVRRDIICDCYKRIVTWGDYYTKGRAIEKVINSGFNEEKQNRMINALEQVSQNGGIAKVIIFNKNEFYQSLRDLSAIGVNPVTIPEGFNISYIQNLLDAHINGPR